MLILLNAKITNCSRCTKFYAPLISHEHTHIKCSLQSQDQCAQILVNQFRHSPTK